MKRERVNDDDEAEGIAYRNTGNNLECRIINIKNEKTRISGRNMSLLPTTLSSGANVVNNEDSQSEDVTLPTANQNSPPTIINVGNNNHFGSQIFFMLPSDSSMTTVNQPAIITRLGQQEICLLGSDESESSVMHNLPKRPVRDDKRRATHNEVERRRRDKINTSITQLANVLPDPCEVSSKHGDSKGAILSKACNFILELQKRNNELKTSYSKFISLKEGLKEVSIKLEEAREENQLLRDHSVHVQTLE